MSVCCDSTSTLPTRTAAHEDIHRRHHQQDNLKEEIIPLPVNNFISLIFYQLCVYIITTHIITHHQLLGHINATLGTSSTHRAQHNIVT